MKNSWFNLGERKAHIKTEIMAGITTFLTMAYIIFVNPGILSATGMDKGALIAATCLASAMATIAVGLIANAPIAMAPGMGLNAFFAYSLVLSGKVNWETALGIVFISGAFFLILTLTGLRQKLVEAIPNSLISAISVGIGLFITFIGLVNLGLIADNPATLVSAQPLSPEIMIGLAGLLIMLVLESRKIPGALLIGIVTSTLLAVLFGLVALPETIFNTRFSIQPIALKLDILGALKWSLFSAIFSLMFMDLFDSLGTLAACCRQADMTDAEGRVSKLGRLLGIDAAATMIGALLGTSTTTAYIESGAGIEQGGKTGLTAVVCGLLFLPALFFLPLLSIVPPYATAPALIMVGLFMIKEIKSIPFDSLDEGFPAFIIMVMIALSYSISTGLAFGFLSFTIMKLVTGKQQDIKPAMWIIAVLSLAFLTQDWLVTLF